MTATLTFEDLKAKTVTDLRHLAENIPHEALKGHTQMNKQHLLKAICVALGIDMHVHHQVVGLDDKTSIKLQIRQLKKLRDQAIADEDHEQLHSLRRQMHHLKRELHKAMA